MTSMENRDQEVCIDLSVLGNQWTMPQNSLFGEPIKVRHMEKKVYVTLSGYSGYLAKLDCKDVL